MKIGETEAFLPPEEEVLTGLTSPIAMYEVDLHGQREAAIADIARIERDFIQQGTGDEVPLEDLLKALGPEYQSAVARKIVFSKIAAELAMRTVTEKLLDDED